MSLGFSPGDLVGLATLSYTIYSFCRDASTELEGLSSRLERIYRKLQRLSSVLQKSGLGTWAAAPEIERHLLELKSFIDPLRFNAKDKTSALLKTRGLMRLAVNRDKLRLLEKGLEADERAIDDMRVDIIIESSMRNMEKMQDLHLHLIDSNRVIKTAEVTTYVVEDVLQSPDPECKTSELMETVEKKVHALSRTISNASTALNMASRLKHRSLVSVRDIGSIHTTEHPNGFDSQTLISTQFVQEIVSIAEETDLYANDASPDDKFQQLDDFDQKVIGVCTVPALFDDGLEVVAQDLALEVGISDMKLLESFSSPAPTDLFWTPSLTCDPWIPPTTYEKHLDTHISPEKTPISPAIDQAGLYNVSELQYLAISIVGRASVSFGSHTGIIDRCSFSILVTGSIVSVQIALVDKPRTRSEACISNAEAKDLSDFGHPRAWSISGAPSSLYIRTARHIFSLQRRPIPHLLHPDVEGPETDEEAPYTITFHEPQEICEDEPHGGQRSFVLLKYAFHEKQDRIKLCQEIFGKTVVMSAGTNKVCWNKREVAHMSAVTLWRDNLSSTYSLTFHPNLISKQGGIGDVEVRLTGICDKKQSHSASSVAFLAALMPGRDHHPSSIKSMAPDGKCTIHFTRRNDSIMFCTLLEGTIFGAV